MNIKNLLKWSLVLIAFLAYKQMDFGNEPGSDEIRYQSPAEERKR